ncbi:MAG: radical SAM protein [Lachnospiraceae bacterium]|jgi:radical SAM protein with 4Fe4S-binding SPASM domain|nr:radical SAM protein [Lachnospiraceae bacterium]
MYKLDNDFDSDFITLLAHEKNIPMYVSIELLTSCNWNCAHCYLVNHSNSGISQAKIFQIFNELRNLGTKDLVLTGGEIFTRPDIMDIISRARKMGFRVSLFSNASLLNENIVDKLVEWAVYEYSCTIFSIVDEVHDKLTGVNGSLKCVLKNIKLLMSKGVNVEVKTPLMMMNYDTLQETKKYFEDLGVKYAINPNISLKMDGSETTKEFRLNEELLRGVLPSIDNVDDFRTYSDLNNEICPNLRYTMTIAANGDIFPCSSFYMPVGNVYKKSLHDIWNSPYYVDLRSLRRNSLKNCADCDDYDFCSFCPGTAYLEGGDMLTCCDSIKLASHIGRDVYYAKHEKESKNGKQV